MSTTTPSIDLLTVEDLSQRLQVRKRKVYDLVRDAGLPQLRLGRALRFRLADVSRWLEQETASEPVPGRRTFRSKVPSYDWSRRSGVR